MEKEDSKRNFGQVDGTRLTPQNTKPSIIMYHNILTICTLHTKYDRLASWALHCRVQYNVLMK
jgi:hypothetical protein